MKPPPDLLNQRARELRQSLTDAERRMWPILRSRRFNGYKFRRQTPLGPYIVDFVCFKPPLIVELDGSQHADNAYDAVRDAWLEAEGFSVLRFWNHQVFQERQSVSDTIWAALQP
jgi:very-short-patch-repair endonuclease